VIELLGATVQRRQPVLESYVMERRRQKHFHNLTSTLSPAVLPFIWLRQQPMRPRFPVRMYSTGCWMEMCRDRLGLILVRGSCVRHWRRFTTKVSYTAT
jgi:hypothetical protein